MLQGLGLLISLEALLVIRKKKKGQRACLLKVVPARGLRPLYSYHPLFPLWVLCKVAASGRCKKGWQMLSAMKAADLWQQ